MYIVNLFERTRRNEFKNRLPYRLAMLPKYAAYFDTIEEAKRYVSGFDCGSYVIRNIDPRRGEILEIYWKEEENV